MGRLWGNLAVGFAVGALLASMPALADSFSVATGTSQTDADQIVDGTAANVVTLTGGGTLVLSNTGNSYTGGTTVSGGSTLLVTVDGNLGAAAGAVTLGDATTIGTLDLSNSTAAVTSSRGIVLGVGGGILIAGVNPWTLSGVISGSGPLVATGGGTLVLGGTNTFSDGISILDGTTVKVSTSSNLSTGAVALGDASTHGTLDLTGTLVAQTSTNTFAIGAGGGTITTGPENWTLSGAISGTGHLTIDGTGELTPTATNSYTGGTTISGGATVVISADAQLGATTGGVTLGGATTTGILQLDSSSAVTSALQLSLDAGGGTIDVMDDAWTIANGITGTGGLTLDGTGVLILDGVNTYTGATTITAGTLQLGTTATTTASIAGSVAVGAGGALTGFGSIFGDVNNVGVISPGASATTGTLTVGGNYVQASTGTLRLLVTSTGASELKVGGTANLDGTLRLVSNGQLHAATYELVSAGAVTGTFSSVSDTLSAALGEQIVYTATGVDLVLTQLTTLPETPTVYAETQSAAIDGGQSANTTLLSHLTGIRTGAAVDEMSMATSPSHRAGASIGSTPYGAWAQGQGGFGSTNGSGSAAGYDVHGGGFMAGIDAQIGRSGVLGVAVGYDITSLSEDGGASSTIHTPRVAVYGGYWWGPLAFDGSVGIGIPSFTADRPVEQTGTTASSSFVGNEITAAGQVSSTFSFGNYALTPAVGVSYTRLRMHAFSEDGAGGYDLDGPASTTESLRPFVAATASTRYFFDARTVLEPTLRVAYTREVLSNSRQIAIEPSGDSQTFLFDGVKPSKGEGSVDLGLLLETSHSMGFYTDASAVGLGNTSGLKFDAGMRYRF